MATAMCTSLRLIIFIAMILLVLRNTTLFWVTLGLWWIYRRYGRGNQSKAIRSWVASSETKSHEIIPEVINTNEKPNFLSPPERIHPSTLFEIIPIEIFQIVLTYFECSDLLNFDNALLNHELRSRYLSALYDLNIFSHVTLKPHQFQWLSSRNSLHPTLMIGALTEVELGYISKFRNDITSISIESKATTTDILEIGACQAMKSFSIPGITEDSLKAFLTFNPQLETLEIPRSQALSTTSIECLATSCQNLYHLNVSKNPWFTDESLLTIIALRPPLKSLNFRFTSVIHEDSISSLLKAYPDIHSVICSTFLSNLLILREVTARSLMSDVPDRQLLALEALNLLLDSLMPPSRFSLVFEEIMKLNLDHRLSKLLSNQMNEVSLCANLSSLSPCLSLSVSLCLSLQLSLCLSVSHTHTSLISVDRT
jgi:hypothetical protein